MTDTDLGLPYRRLEGAYGDSISFVGVTATDHGCFVGTCETHSEASTVTAILIAPTKNFGGAYDSLLTVKVSMMKRVKECVAVGTKHERKYDIDKGTNEQR